MSAAERITTTSGRFVFTGRHPNPIDTWALNAWNSGVLRAREAYYRDLERMERSTLYPCEQCRTRRTKHKSGVCYPCRKRIINRKMRPCPTCKGFIQDQTADNCWACRDRERKAIRASKWTTCVRKGCGRATQKSDRVCSRCRSGKVPNGPGNHWSFYNKGKRRDK